MKQFTCSKAVLVCSLILIAAFSADAATGSADSAIGALETVSPTFTILPITERGVSATFSETMLDPGITTPGSYAVSDLGAGTLNPNPDGVGGSGPYALTWTVGEMQGSVNVTVTAAGLQDLVGNPINPAGNSASCPGLGIAPVFSNLEAAPAQAKASDTVTLTFTVSEPLDANPTVTVNDNGATFVSAGSPTEFTYEYVVQPTDPLGMAEISVFGFDLAENQGSLSNNVALEIIEEGPGVPLRAWPLGTALLMAGLLVLAWRRRRASVLLLLLMAMLVTQASLPAFAQAPTVSNVTFSQSPDGTTGTKVDIYYDLVTDTPCDITLSLSKDGGADLFIHPISHYTGDLADLTTGSNYHIVWDIRADYPEEDISEAQIRVTADNEPIQHTLTYEAGPYGSVTGTTPQTVDHGGTGTAVEAVPEEGYHFVDWSDGSTENPRTDTVVTTDMTVTACFAFTVVFANIDGYVEPPNGTPLAPQDFTLVSAGGESPFNEAWEYESLPVWDNGSGQFLFVEDSEGTSVLMMYLRPEEVTTEADVVLTTAHVALALIAMQPACFMLDDRQRREVLDIAQMDADFNDLLLLINQAVDGSIEQLSDYDTFPAIYELAAAISNDAMTAWQDMELGGEKSQVGSSNDPHLDDYPGNGMNLYNPHLVFYGVEWYGQEGGWTVLRGRDGLTKLIPPSWSDIVEKGVSLPNGNYTVEFWKGQGAFWSTNPAERAGAHANVYKALILAIDIIVGVYAPPAGIVTGILNSNELIEFLTTNPSEANDDIVALYETIDIDSADDAFSVFKKVVSAITNEGVYEGSLTQKLAHTVYRMTDTDGRKLARHFKNANSWLTTVMKAFKVYDILNTYVPFHIQTFFYRNHYLYEINVQDGVLTLGYAEIPPVAALTSATALPAVGQSVAFDASASTDDTDPLSALSFRFDFEADGTWDTTWAVGDPAASHVYATTGKKTCVVEVKDTGALTGQATYYLNVVEAGTGTIEINVTPDTGNWRLYGPPGFTSLSGTGDRTGGSAITGAPVGSYSLICYDNIPNYNPPGTQTASLATGGAITFNAVWTGGGGTEETIMLPGGVPLVMVWIPAGSFLMGRYPGEQDSYSYEDPQHSVTLSSGFWMGKYEVTQQQWIAVQSTWPGTAPSASYGLGNTYPAYYISWDDTKNFITTLNAYIISSGQGPLTVRLPSEAEWEYACRAGTATRFYFGDSLGCAADCTDCAAGVLPGNRSDYMWYCGNNSPNGSKPVGGKTPNAFGLFDMSGNLWEWCEDDWHSTYTGAPADGSAWIDSPTRASYRMFRGGYWFYNARYCRSADRYSYAPGIRFNRIGFRVAAVR
ncbi:MAG TPA: SUMF1/EgtB/PvdO family nonheme iron enzyme [Candidatus Bathyarchaeia archaeon]|nr:SUMF1/EgtB/PvdO family nonheme iron enzyme [Candidatus Bathyarchaeia archaeon]